MSTCRVMAIIKSRGKSKDKREKRNLSSPVFPLSSFLFSLPSKGLGLLDHFVDGADHVERLLRDVVVFAVDDAAEAADGFLERHVLARGAGEHFGHEERRRAGAPGFGGPGAAA